MPPHEDPIDDLKDPRVFRKEELIQILQHLIAINTENPPGREEPAARYILDLLHRNGIESELQWAAPERPNLIARLKGRRPGPSIIYNGHLDVVPAGSGWTHPPFGGGITEGRLYGRGAADMKSGVAAMLYAAIVLKRLGLPFAGEIILFFNVDEERLNLGMNAFLAEEVYAHYAVVGEPTGLKLCMGHLGCSRFFLRTRGTPGHTSVVTHPDNAIYKMANLIGALERLDQAIRQRGHPVLGRGSLTVSTIKGGTAVNIVPEICEIEIDRRTFPNETLEAVQAEIEDCLRSVSVLDGTSYALESYQSVPATLIDREAPLVKHLAGVTERIQQAEPVVASFDATCEAPFLSVQKGIPTVIFGPGDLKQAHIHDEYVELEAVEKAAKIYALLAFNLPQPSST